jgi:DNA mismatch repair protein MutS2
LDEIEEKSYRSLEWERLKSFLKDEASSPLGRVLCQALSPFQAINDVHCALDETEEALFLLQKNSGLTDLSKLPLLQEQLCLLEARATLSANDILALKIMLKIAHSMKSHIGLLNKESFPNIYRYYLRLHSLPKLSRDIEEVIDDSANILDQASKLLGELRQDASRLQSQIVNELQRIIYSSTLSKALQEQIYTIRNGRFVLPVTAHNRGVIQGIVHDSSSSGLTIYVEPLSVLELSNKKRLKEQEIEREIARILTVLSSELSQHCQQLKENYETIGQLDLIFARARLALKYDGRKPELSQSISISYKQARHPLLVLQNKTVKVIPNDIIIGDDSETERTLIITGPNTGGKTVLLKTVGIFALMTRAGLLLPVESGSKTCLFDKVYADIGDEQSLEQSLSTFSSHIQNIVHIANSAKKGTLVLLDEVGAGTDPQEGAALARSLLEFFSRSGSLTIATTHFSELKTMAYSDRAFLNGSLEFDEVTLSPSYRLRLGIPGSSKATTIARRLGLKDSIVDRAIDLLASAKDNLQSTIERFEERMCLMNAREDELSENLKYLSIEREKLNEEKIAIELNAEKTSKTRLFKLEEELQTAKDYIKQLIADLQKEPSIAKAQRVQKELEALRSELGWHNQKTTNSPAATFIVGQHVKVKSLNQRGVIQSINAKKGLKKETEVLVKSGHLSLKVQASDLEFLDQEHLEMSVKQKKGSGKKIAHELTQSKRENKLQVFVRTSNNTLDLRGQRVDEALGNLDQFVNQAMVHGTSPLMVIHGHGTGALKNAVREALGAISLEGFRSGETYEGGDGVTLIDL